MSKYNFSTIMYRQNTYFRIIIIITVPTTCSRPSTKMSAFSFFFFFFFFVADTLARAFEIKSRNCAKKVLCYRKTYISVYDNFSREYLSQILSGNVCKNCTLQNIKYERCGYFFIIGKLIIFHYSLRQKELQNSQWFARYRGLKVPYFLSPSSGTMC